MEYVAVADTHARNEAYDPAIRLVEKALQLERLRRAHAKQSALVQELSADQLGTLFAAVEPIRMGRHAAVMRQGQIISRGHDTWA